jgi:cyclase
MSQPAVGIGAWYDANEHMPLNCMVGNLEICTVDRRHLPRPANLIVALTLVLTLAASAPGVAGTSETFWTAPTRVNLAAGVFLFISPDVAGNVVGNSIAIVTDNDVVIFDATLLPATATTLLNELRAITSNPVRIVVNSHWHPDHTGGNEIFAAAFPDLEIVSSIKTRQLMEGTAKVYVKTLEFELAQTNQEINEELRSGKSSDGKTLADNERQNLRTQMAMEDRFLKEFKAEHILLPTVTFDDNLTLYHGGREIQLVALPGHTAGDIALYLPAEKILLTGDLLAYPVPFCADSHPSAWIASLEVLSRLDASTIVPGHGAAQHDHQYLTLVLDSLQAIAGQVRQALDRGLTLSETLKAVHLESIRTSFTHDDPDLNAQFDGNFVPIVRQMYDEATEGLEQYQ